MPRAAAGRPPTSRRRAAPKAVEDDPRTSAASEADQIEGGALDPDAGVAAFLATLDRGEPWYDALLQVIARWTAAEETVDGVPHTYLVAGEAFDWLRLAERLITAAGKRVPAEEAERLLVRGEAPDGSDEDEFARAIGPWKHRAHLNFQYGIVIEETLLLAAEMDLNKARTIDGPRGEPPDVVAYEQVYGKPLAELLVLYHADTGNLIGSRVSESDWQSFIYWCSKFRFRTGEPARVASDTRKALALLSRLRAERARPAPTPAPDQYVDSTLATAAD
jgi:hypothetical protein